MERQADDITIKRKPCIHKQCRLVEKHSGQHHFDTGSRWEAAHTSVEQSNTFHVANATAVYCNTEAA